MIFYGLKHLVVKVARVDEARHEEFALATIGIESVLKCLSHFLYLLDQVRQFTPRTEQTAPLPLFL